MVERIEDQTEAVEPVDIAAVKRLGQLRDQVRSQERSIQEWIFAQIPKELLGVSNVATLDSDLARNGSAGFRISKLRGMVEHLGGDEAVQALLAQMQERLQPIAEVEIEQDARLTMGDIEVRVRLRE